jgi:hypothetical protein
MFMPLAKLVQYQHCLLRRKGVRTEWSFAGSDLRETLARIRQEIPLIH